MSAPTVALVTWVKTPGRTPAKTRLAATIGARAAEEFYAACVDALRELAAEAAARSGGAIVPYWAVAEPDALGDARWRGAATIAQGEGGLGERLARVHDALAVRHAAVLFIGADAPHVDAAALLDAARCLTSADAPDFVLGPAEDGGFWLWGGRRRLPPAAWTEVAYSAPTTLAELRARLLAHGTVHDLARDFDVDTVDELRRLRDVLTARDAEGPARARLREWLLAHVPQARA